MLGKIKCSRSTIYKGFTALPCFSIVYIFVAYKKNLNEWFKKVNTYILHENQLRCSTCPLVFGVASWVTWFFSSWERKNCLQSRANLQNDNHFRLKRSRTILSENSCHFVNLLSFASSSFFLSMRKITRLNPQQLKTRPHVEYLND